MIDIAPLSIWMLSVLLLLVLTAIVSAVLYWRRARRLDAMLVLCAAFPLIVLLLQVKIGDVLSTVLVLDSRKPLPPASELRSALTRSSSLVLQGDGLFAGQWQDLPAKKMVWQRDTIPAGELLQLDFPQQLAYGRIFQLSVARPLAKGAWRLQLLADNQQILAEQKGVGNRLSVSWLPPVAERLVLQARVLNEADQVLDQGPIPLDVISMPPLQVQGRFAAASFDLQALTTLLSQSDAVLDWQTQLGKGIVRKETARLVIDKPAVFIQDAAYFEQLPTTARQQLLAQIAAGATLIILGANAQQPVVWSSVLGLRLRQSVATEALSSQGIYLTNTDRTPVNAANQLWRMHPAPNAEVNLLAQRDWQQGKIVWVAASNWHQAMISEPQKLKLWWQAVLDLGNVHSAQEWQITLDRLGQSMSVPQQQLALCGRGLDHRMIEVLPQNASEPIRLQMQALGSRAEAQCAAFWPTSAGWHAWQTRADTEVSKTAVQARGSLYVFQALDWPTWQRQQKQQATELYAQRLAEAVDPVRQKLVMWPFILLSMSAFLLLWWREQRD